MSNFQWRVFLNVLLDFSEQEITGDVLLDLDVNLLKSEIGIPAFGKRTRIANCITDLRRPPSVVYSDQAPSQSISQSQSLPYTFSHSHSQSQSFHSSAHNSFNGPFYPGGLSAHGPQSPGYGSVMSAESPLHTGDLPGTPLSPLGKDLHRVSDPIPAAHRGAIAVDTDDKAHEIRAAMERSAMVGLGLGVPGAFAANGHRNRPAQLTFSPSDSNLVSARAIAGDIPEETEEERAVVSEVRDSV
jgi:hypothetical protein